MDMSGEWTPKLDDKFRLTLPAECREKLGDEVVVVCSQEPCLSVYPKAVFEAMMAPFNEAPPTFKRVRDYQRWIYSRARNVTLDKQGRITVNAKQKTWASLEKDTTVVGVGNRLEVWNPEVWESYDTTLDDDFANFDGVLIPGGAI